jgi:hypothetical protein
MMTSKMRVGLATPVMRATMNKWTVWVGGSEVNWQHYAYRIDAERVSEFYREVKGYDDVVVEEIA